MDKLELDSSDAPGDVVRWYVAAAISNSAISGCNFVAGNAKSAGRQLALAGPTPSMGKLVLPPGFIVSSPANRQSAQEWILVEKHESDEMVNLVFTRGGQPQDKADQVITVRWWWGHVKLDPEQEAKKSAAWMRGESGNCLYSESEELVPNPAYTSHALLVPRHHARCDKNRYPAEWFARRIDPLETVSAFVKYTFKDPPKQTEREYALKLFREFKLVPE